MPLQPFRSVGQVDSNLQGIGLLQNIQRTRNNELLNLAGQNQLDEFDANAGVREAKRQSDLQKFEIESHVVGARALRSYLDAADQAETIAAANGIVNIAKSDVGSKVIDKGLDWAIDKISDWF